MFRAFEKKVTATLKKAFPWRVVPDSRIYTGPIEQPAILPAIAFTAGDFDILPDDEMATVPKATEEVRFSVACRMEVWAATMDKVEKIALKAMAVIAVKRKEIEEGAGSEFTMENLKMTFVSEKLRAVKGVKTVINATSAKAEVEYKVDGLMTVTRLDFSHGMMEIIDTSMTEPSEIGFQANDTAPVLDMPSSVITGIGETTSSTLSGLGIISIKDLSEAEPALFVEDIANIETHIHKAKEIIRIFRETLEEIADRETPFTENLFTLTLTDILAMTAEAISLQTGKSAENVSHFLENLGELETLLNATEFAPLGLRGFIS